MYDTGKGVPQDSAEAVRWHRLAAEQGDAKAQNDLMGGEPFPDDRSYTRPPLRLAILGGGKP